MNWDNYENFSEKEFTCSCGCGETKMDEDFMERLQELRTRAGFGFRITSGYRCSNHPNERARAERGEIGPHTTGRAADIAVSYGNAYTLLMHIMRQGGWTGVGVAQKGDGRFLHIDTLTDADERNDDGLCFPRPNLWSY